MNVRSRAAAICLSALLVAVAARLSTAAADAAATIPNDEPSISHALNRLAYGARPGDVARIKHMGLAAWIDQQLRPARVADAQLDTRLARLTTLPLDAKTVAHDYYMPARQERRRRQQAAGRAQGPGPRGQADMNQAPGPGDQSPIDQGPARRAQAAGAREPGTTEAVRRGRQVLVEMAEAKILRATYSERQLEEVLVDFWFNHFNVFARKGQTEIYIGEYERDVIRPNVLGNFRDLLGATAQSPAMLVYLDNWRSTNRGLNENYARELLELHTVGVDGGYTQQDIVSVARAFTGWTIGRPAQPGFRFAANLHDRDEKKVLGQTINAGGRADGDRLLDLLASHPSTATHIAYKLAQRFVSDTPPASVVTRAADTFRNSKGNLREVVRTIITSPEFFAPTAHQAKVKTPFEFVVSALRATNAEIRTAQPLLRTLADLGMPLYLCQPPTGYDETSETWVSSGALVNRINFALAVANGEVRGVQVDKSRASALSLGSAGFQKQ